ncbi:MAG: hypothetical protein H6Q81_288 [Deltaproteobacteria bacterium]|nr:hypothetical protein [Deltaproteobacteria bacterium]
MLNGWNARLTGCIKLFVGYYEQKACQEEKISEVSEIRAL